QTPSSTTYAVNTHVATSTAALTTTARSYAPTPGTERGSRPASPRPSPRARRSAGRAVPAALQLGRQVSRPAPTQVLVRRADNEAARGSHQQEQPDHSGVSNPNRDVRHQPGDQPGGSCVVREGGCDLGGGGLVGVATDVVVQVVAPKAAVRTD